ncbi:hypothetical protein ACP4OV_004497 [Aristida adscensionis]
MEGQTSNAIDQVSSSDMSISTEDDGTIQHKEISTAKENGEVQSTGLLVGDPEFGMAFESGDHVWQYYTKYAESKGFGVTVRSSGAGDDGKLKYLTLSYSRRQGKSQSKSSNVLKPHPLAGQIVKQKLMSVVDQMTAISIAVYDSLTPEDFEIAWKHMIDEYHLSDNDWLQDLYNNRHRWVPAFVKDCFWADGQSKAIKRCTMSSSVPDQVNDISHIFPQDDVGHSGSNLSIHAANFNQHMSADVNSGQSPSLGVPLIHGEFTSLLLGVQQSAVAVPTPGELLYDEWHTNPLHQG